MSRPQPDRLPPTARDGSARVRHLLQHTPAAPLARTAAAPSQVDSHPCPRWRVASPPARPTRRSAPRIRTRCVGPVAISNRQPLGLRQRVPEAPAPRSGPQLDRSTRREMIPQNRLSKTEPNEVEANRVSGTDTQMIVSADDIAPDIAGIQNVCIQVDGCATAMTYISSLKTTLPRTY